MNLFTQRNECRIADALHEGETTVAELARKSKLSVSTIRNILGVLILRGEVESRRVPDRSGEPGRVETRYSLMRTKRIAA